MARRLLAKATTAALAGTVLLSSEIVFDLTAMRPVIGDGTTAGGQPLALLSDLGGLRVDTAADNLILGGPANSLTGAAAGAHDGDSNLIISTSGAPTATSVYATTAVGPGAGYALTTGHSHSLFGYQAGHSLTTGIMNTLGGVDAGLLMATGSYNTVFGHHCLNQGVFTGSGAVIIGQQTARPLTGGDYMIWIGRNAGANAPATGSDNCQVIGGAAAIAASVSKSALIGSDIFAIAGAVSDSFLGGYRNHYGGGTIANSVSIGGYGFFRGTGGGGTGNVGLGYQHGYSIAGDYNLFLGNNSGYRSSNTTVSAAICIGPSAGFNMVTTGDLYIGNSDALSAHLIWGNFTGQVLNLRANHLSLVDLPSAANDAGAASAGVAVGELYENSSTHVITKRAA